MGVFLRLQFYWDKFTCRTIDCVKCVRLRGFQCVHIGAQPPPLWDWRPFPSPPKENCHYWSLSSWQLPVYFLFLWICLLWAFPVMWSLLWLAAFTWHHGEFIYAGARISTPFLFICNTTTNNTWTCPIFFMHSSIDGHVGFSHCGGCYAKRDCEPSWTSFCVALGLHFWGLLT